MDSAGRPKKRRWKPILLGFGVALFFLLGVLGAGGFLIVTISRQIADRPIADERLRTLEREFSLIPAVPGASQVRLESSHKVTLGSVSADYQTDKNYQEIRRHYDVQLMENGWKFMKEKPVKIWGRDYGGKEAFYCKDHYTATLQYAGDSKVEFGWTYNFNLSWGLEDLCD